MKTSTAMVRSTLLVGAVLAVVFGIALAISRSETSFDAPAVGGRKVADVSITCRSPIEAIRDARYPSGLIQKGPEYRRACAEAERTQGVQGAGLVVAAGAMVMARRRTNRRQSATGGLTD